MFACVVWSVVTGRQELVLYRLRELATVPLLQVRSVVGLSCELHAAWCQQLLQLASPHLEDLELSCVQSDHLREVQRMDRLSKLNLAMSYSARNALEELPLQLVELTLENPTTRQLQCIQGMTRLKKLHLQKIRTDAPALPMNLEEVCLHCPTSQQQLESLQHIPQLRKLSLNMVYGIEDAPELPVQVEDLCLVHPTITQLQSLHRVAELKRLEVYQIGVRVQFNLLPPMPYGILRLHVDLKTPSTALSLIAACTDTLQDLEVTCATTAGAGYYVPHLGASLKNCRLKALRSLVLKRDILSGTHKQRSCRRQIEAVKKDLFRRDADAEGQVTVRCHSCS